jgi:glycosyltransferase involved in cell wall biosynthesis
VPEPQEPTAETPSGPKPAVSVVIPVYNSREILPRLVDELLAVLARHTSEHEVLLVNDGSPDGSWSVVCELAAAHPALRGLDLMRNYGQHNAILCGLRAARHPLVITMDDDLQHPPAEIPRLLARLTPDVDVVYGTPQQEQHGLWRPLASRITKLALQSAMGAETARKVSAFRLLRRDLRLAFAEYTSPYVSIDVLLTWATTRFVALPVSHAPRASGESNYTLRTLIKHALTMTTGFSVLPLHFATLVGFLFTLLGFVLLVFVIVRRIVEGQVVPGFAFLAAAISIFSGAQLFALGIIGEYLARMHFRSMNKPTYVVREHPLRPQKANDEGQDGPLSPNKAPTSDA